jgi:hypothetical protein
VVQQKTIQQIGFQAAADSISGFKNNKRHIASHQMSCAGQSSRAGTHDDSVNIC